MTTHQQMGTTNIEENRINLKNIILSKKKKNARKKFPWVNRWNLTEKLYKGTFWGNENIPLF